MQVHVTEDKILEFWRKEKIYEKLKKKLKNKRKFYFLDGPPYATGFIHVGTAFNKVLKDCYLRFLRMLGFNAWDQPGYDCHGVPIEHKVEEKLGFRTKKDIEIFGVGKFIEECRKFATQYIDVMNKQFENLGVWMDWKNPYLTLTNEYIEGAWYTFKKAFEKGLLFKGSYPVHLCPRCQTVVAYNEIEYAKVTDPSIYVKFKLKNKEKQYLLAWTTTPWTIPANVAIMVHPDFEYAKVKVGNETLIIAKDLVEKVMKEAGVKDYEIIEILKGKELKDLQYEHPLAGLFPFHEKLRNAWRVVLSEKYVSLEEGTGLVHCAPGHGKEDFEVGVENNLPAPSPVKMDGCFNEECGKFSGKYVKDADKEIIEELRKRGALFFEGKITHDYPLCWRCDTPLLLVLIPQWFFRITQMREKLLKENEKINWVPDWAGKRFKNWLESLGDWPISRQRYWGIPLPIWECEKCGRIKVVGSRKELPKKLKDLHKPAIDEVYLKCKCGGRMRRVPDVLDVWFDSGVAPWASLGFPNNKKLFKGLWPVKFVLEGPDQIRGWWNSLLITSLITFGRRSFENVLFHGFVLDAHGVKMSKSRGNVVTTEEVIEKYGRDVLRAYYLSSPCWDDYYFKWEDVEEIARKFNIIRNTFNFIQTYVKEKGKPKNFELEDKWLLSRLNSLVESCTNNFKKYQAHKALNEIFDFILEDLSRFYIKKVRDRVWLAYKGKDKQAAFFTLFTTTETVCRLLAPFCPFISEEIYQKFLRKFNGKEKSIHLYPWPKVNKKYVDKELEANVEIARKIIDACSLARQKANLKLKWPVKEVLVKLKDENLKKAIVQTEKLLKYFCNSKKVKVVEEVPTNDYLQVEFELGTLFLNKKLDEELLEEALVREIIREVQELRKKHGFKVEQRITLSLNSDESTNKILEKNAEKIKDEVGARKVVVGKLIGKFEGSLQFRDKRIDIRFSK
jgi:isoleucyl-tRNA synthetase